MANPEFELTKKEMDLENIKKALKLFRRLEKERISEIIARIKSIAEIKGRFQKKPDIDKCPVCGRNLDIKTYDECREGENHNYKAYAKHCHCDFCKYEYYEYREYGIECA